jgi:hypothetical protein
MKKYLVMALVAAVVVYAANRTAPGQKLLGRAA